MRKTAVPQYSLASCAGILERENHELFVADCVALHQGAADVIEKLHRFAPRLVVLNTSTPSITGDLAFSDAVKAALPSVYLALFGTHVTVFDCEILEKNESVDAVLRHEPEASLPLLVTSLDNTHQTTGPLPGITRRIDGAAVQSDETPLVEHLDSLAPPAWHYLPLDRYRHPVFHRPYLMVNTARGCPHRCIFCVGHLFYGRRVRQRSITSIIGELEEDLSRYSCRHFWFFADDFTGNTCFVKNLCREIIARRLPVTWWANTRADCTDGEMFALMRRAGCTMLSIGGESGSPGILSTIGKKTTREDLTRIVRILRRHRITSLMYFLIGLPGETGETIEETIRFARACDPDYAEFYPAIPYPGTDLWQIAREKGLIDSKEWNRYLCGGKKFVMSVPGLSEDELSRTLSRAYHRFYRRPAVLLRLFIQNVASPVRLLRLFSFGLSYFARFTRRENPS